MVTWPSPSYQVVKALGESKQIIFMILIHSAVLKMTFRGTLKMGGQYLFVWFLIYWGRGYDTKEKKMFRCKQACNKMVCWMFKKMSMTAHHRLSDLCGMCLYWIKTHISAKPCIISRAVTISVLGSYWTILRHIGYWVLNIVLRHPISDMEKHQK